MRIRRAIVNLFTLSNLLCGAFAVYFASQSRGDLAALLVLAGAGFDVLDGLVARALGVAGELGKQLDSLADIVTFGLAPAFIALNLNGVFEHPPTWGPDVVLMFFPMVIPAFAAYRLAKFNIDPRQSEGFIGLPTPSNALFWLSVPLAIAGVGSRGLDRYFVAFASSPLYVAIASVALGWLMIAEIPLISLKFKSFNFLTNARRYALIALSLLLFAIFGFASVPIVLLLYFLLSISKKSHAIQS